MKKLSYSDWFTALSPDNLIDLSDEQLAALGKVIATRLKYRNSLKGLSIMICEASVMQYKLFEEQEHESRRQKNNSH